MAESEIAGGGTSGVDGASSSSYGKACVNCVRSKTKCTPRNEGGKCERCLRLNKGCEPAPVVRKRRAPKKPTSSIASVATRATALERRLDDVVHLLHSQASSSTHDSEENTDPDWEKYGFQRSREPLTPAASTNSATRDAKTLDYPLETKSECQEYLDTYRYKMVPFFPVVVIGPNVTVNQLRADRPFLWLVIRAICSKSSTRQRALWQEVRKELGRQMLIEGIKCLDLLLGTLVFASWGHYRLYRENIITTDIQLALSLAYDLGLLKPPNFEPVMLNYNAHGCPKPPISTSRSLEERRAAVGLFLISSVVAHFFQRIDPIPWTPYLEKCLHFLQDAKDSPTDILLTQLVKVQLLRNKVASIQASNSYRDCSTRSGLPYDIYIQTFKSQLEELKRSIPSELESNTTLQLYILDTALAIHEHSLVVCATKEPTLDPAASLQRVEYLWTCLTAVKSWFEIFWNEELFPLSTYPQFPMSIFTQSAYCMVTLFRLTTFDAPGVPWDRQRVLREFNFGELMRKCMVDWGKVPAAAGLDIDMGDKTENSSWVHSGKLMNGIVNWWEAKVAPKLAEEVRRNELQQAAGDNGFGITDQQPLEQMDGIDFSGLNLDLLNDDWMRDVLGSGCEFFRESFTA